MRRTIRNAAALLFVMVMVVSVLTVPAFAKSGKAGKEVSSAAGDGTILRCEAELKEPHGAPDLSMPGRRPFYEAEVSRSQARQIALDDAGLDGETLKYVVCNVSWVDPYAYKVEFSTRAAYYHYTIALNSGAILAGSRRPYQ